jgi:glycosyltransferase involved in cell wall biosynthesis
MLRRVDVVYFEAGSGHRSAALALQRRLAEIRPTWRTRALDLVDVVAAHRLFQATTRAGVGYFNRMLTRERVVDLEGLIRLSLLCNDLLSRSGVERIARFWRDDPPDAVVSVTPMNNETLIRAARVANPRARYLTVPVDFEEVMARYWFTPRHEVEYLVGSARLAEQAIGAGVAPERVHRLSGMVVDPALYDPPPIDRATELGRLGLDPALPTGVIHFGGQGSVVVRGAAHGIAAAGIAANLIVLCGRAERVRAELADWAYPHPKLVLGWAPETPVYHYRLADFVVGTPGTMTMVEALVAGCPVVAIESGGMKPVQRGNERWLTSSGAGIVAKLDDLGAAVGRVLADPETFRAAAARHAGRGVFEAADAIASVAEPARAR